MERFQEFMSKRIYGVPVAVVAVIVAAVVLVVALRLKKSAATDATATDTATDEPTGDAADSTSADSPNATFQASPITPTVIAQPTEDTNDLWAGRARDWLSAHGSTPTDAQAVVGRYLAGDPLSASDKALIDRVIAALGYPPEPPDLVSADPDTPTTTTPDPVTVRDTQKPPTKQGTPPCRHKIVNAKDNGPGELAMLYYGSKAPAKVNRLEAANWELGAGPWPVGTTVKIPEDHQPVWFTTTAEVRGVNQIAGKNGVNPQFIKTLNPGMNFPVPKGTRVRVN